MNKQKFVLLTTQRSGSTAFRLLLNNHSKIRCHDEVFLKESGAQDAINSYVKKRDLFTRFLYKTLDYKGDSRVFKKLLYQNYKYRDSLVHADNLFTRRLLKNFIDDLFNNPQHSAPWTSVKTWNDFHANENFNEEKAIGCNIMYYEVQNNYISNWIANDEIKIVHLMRRNKLEKLISSRLAKMRKSWHSEDKVNDIKIELPTEKLLEQLSYEVAQDEKMQSKYKGDTYIEVDYELFKNSPQEAVAPVLQFLSVGSELLETPLKKMSGAPRDTLSNFEEVYKVLKGTEFAKFIS